jgi:thiamine biosynthesis lipoprotein ApbE
MAHRNARPANRLLHLTYIDLPGTEVIESFRCFGGNCTVIVTGGSGLGTARQSALRAKQRLLDWHDQFSRFLAESELSGLNCDARETVPVRSDLAQFVQSALTAAALTGGLVDPTLVEEIE